MKRTIGGETNESQPSGDSAKSASTLSRSVSLAVLTHQASTSPRREVRHHQCGLALSLTVTGNCTVHTTRHQGHITGHTGDAFETSPSPPSQRGDVETLSARGLAMECSRLGKWSHRLRLKSV